MGGSLTFERFLVLVAAPVLSPPKGSVPTVRQQAWWRPPFRAAIPGFLPAASGLFPLELWGSGSFLLEPLDQRSLFSGSSTCRLRALHHAPFYPRCVPENSQRSRHKPPFFASKEAFLLCRSLLLLQAPIFRREVDSCAVLATRSSGLPSGAGNCGPGGARAVPTGLGRNALMLDHVIAAPIDTSPVGRLTRSPPVFSLLC